jgi:hypothetical protein
MAVADDCCAGGHIGPGIRQSLHFGQPPETGIGGEGNKKVTSKCGYSTGERQIFPTADNRCHYGRKSHARLGCGTDQSQNGYFKLY